MNKLVLGAACALVAIAAPVRADEITGGGYAFVVGIDNYKSPAWPKLRYAAKDARGVAAYLETQGLKVISLFDGAATRKEIVHQLEDVIAAQLRSGDRLVVFFSGHGTTRSFGSEEYGYIVPVDGDDNPSSYISMEELQTLSRKMGAANHQLFIMDACYGGRLSLRGGNVVLPHHPRYLQEVSRRRARQILTAGGKDQKVMDGGPLGHSVFTGYLLQALQEGHGDTNGDGYVTFFELYDYLLPTASNAQQTPGQGELAGHEGGQFLFRVGTPTGGAAVQNTIIADNGNEPLRGGETISVAFGKPDDWVRIEPGEFLMGSPVDEIGRSADEESRHRVRITRPFLIKKTEVTQGEWEMVRGGPDLNPSRFFRCGPECPIDNVSFLGTLNFLNDISRRAGLQECYQLNGCTRDNWPECGKLMFTGLDCTGYRLPTEAEWEYAARAGETGQYYGEGQLKHAQVCQTPALEDIAWYNGNCDATHADAKRAGLFCELTPPNLQRRCSPHPVGQKVPNAWGLHDMLGNVSEWVWDEDFGDYRVHEGTMVVDPIRDAQQNRMRRIRGCGFRDRPSQCRLAYRYRNVIIEGADDRGFRIVQTIRSKN
jgi:formylglycine-generating enzyme required for sulfatase activity/uncharacterized caspase-like protein